MKTLIRNLLLATMTLIVHQLAGQNMTLDGSVISITEGSSIKVKGNLEITGPVTVNNSGEITVGGNWINTAPADFSLEGTSGKVILNGATPQMISGNFANIFSNLHLQNDVALDIGVTISASLLLEDAVLSLNKMDLQLMPGAEITGAGPTAYIAAHGEGRLMQHVSAGDVLFPIGSNTFYLPVLLSNGGIPDNFGVNLFPDVLTDGVSGNTIAQIENTIGNTWVISEDVPGGSDLSLTLWWNSSIEGNLFDRLQSGIGLYADGQWQAQEAGAASGDDPYSLTRTAITQTGAFAVGDINSPMAFSDFINEQMINLPGGWSGWSSYIDPTPENDFAAVVDPVVEDIIISSHFNKLFYPAFNINTMGQFSNQHGYIIKMAAERTLTLEGMMAGQTIMLSAGWNILPVLSPCNLDADEMLGQIGGLIIAFEVAGNGIYYPEMNINTLQTLFPGKAYFVKVQNSIEISFPACGKNATYREVIPIRANNNTPWNDPVYSGASHIVIFDPNTAANFQHGDMIGAFTGDGFCAGLTTVTGNAVSMSLFGNDFTSGFKDGFEEGEQLTFKLYRGNSNTEYSLEVDYSSKAPNSDGNFATNGLSVISNAMMSPTGIVSPDLIGLTIYPNPSTGIFTLDVERESFNMAYVITNSTGQSIAQGNLSASQQIDLSNHPKGVYMIRITGDNLLMNRKLVVK